MGNSIHDAKMTDRDTMLRVVAYAQDAHVLRLPTEEEHGRLVGILAQVDSAKKRKDAHMRPVVRYVSD